MKPEFFDVPVHGGGLRVARFGDGPHTVLGIHGVTASSMSLAPIARHLGAEFSVVAPDLRGRGDSNQLPGPFGMGAHAADCAAVLQHLGTAPTVVVGESMGAFVAVVLAARRPELVERLVLVDGGLPPPLPEGIDVDQVLDAVLGPAIARLRQTFPTEKAYLDFWRDHPALSEDWSDDIEAYLLYDLEPAGDGGFKSKVSEDAVRADGAQNITDVDVVADSLRALECPVNLLRAVRGLLNQPVPLLPDFVVDMWRPELPQLVDEIVDDTNHYTICFGDRGAKVVAERIKGA
ncbi:MAG: alpha/beta hydrolase [Acidimicrobiia bacterium]|nr:alpha/beta hydrolase [Acidimicrobiia bacterium]